MPFRIRSPIRAFVAAACAAILVSSADANAQPAPFEARIGAWNLGAAVSSSGDRYIESWRIPNLARVIAILGPDVIALSEVAPDSRLADLVERLAIAGLCYRPAMVSQPSKLNVAFLHRCNVTAANARLVPNSGYGTDDNRKVLAVDFRVGNFDFTAMAVHFKSGRSNSDRTLRDEQVAAVWGYLEGDVLPSEKDVLILGDYNMIPGRDGGNFDKLNPDGYLRFVTSEELGPLPGFNKVFSHIGSSGSAGNLLDGYAISKDHSSEYQVNSVAILPMHSFLDVDLAKFKRSYSDHLPMMAVFWTGADDD